MMVVNYIALCIGYLILSVTIVICLYALYSWILYGNVGNSISVRQSNGELYINNDFIGYYNGNTSINNNKVYIDNKLVYTYKRKFRWEK